jgi:tetratricopeptide (TPR) repeat protein
MKSIEKRIRENNRVLKFKRHVDFPTLEENYLNTAIELHLSLREQWSHRLLEEPNNPICLFNRGVETYTIGDNDYWAIEDFTRVIELLPSAEKAYYLRACLRKQMGDEIGSQQDFDTAFRLNPSVNETIGWGGW